LNSDDGFTHDHYIYDRPVRRGHVGVQRDDYAAGRGHVDCGSSSTPSAYISANKRYVFAMLCVFQLTHCVSAVFYSYSDSSTQTCSRSRASPMPAILPRCRHLLRHVVSPLQSRHLIHSTFTTYPTTSRSFTQYYAVCCHGHRRCSERGMGCSRS